MSDWRQARLGEFLKIKHGYAFIGKYITDIFNKNILVTPGNFHLGGGFKTTKFKCFNGDFPSEYVLKEGDIVVTMTDLSKESDTLGYSAMIPTSRNGEKYLHNQRIGLVQFTSNEVNQDYIYWLLRTFEYHWYVVSSASGTSIMHTSPSRICNYEFSLPPLQEQQAIAEILSSLDNKIDLLHRQNQTLEQMAETLFRQWFIEEAKEEWETGILSDEFDFTMGQSPPGNTYNEDGEGVPMYQGNADFGFRFPSLRVFTTDPKRLAQKYDTLISVRAPVGAQNMASEECCIGRGVAAFRYKKAFFKAYTYNKMMSLISDIKQFNDTGTVFGSISKSDFERIEIIVPPYDLVMKFEMEIGVLDDKIINNVLQIKTLEQQRDTLLPKLMNGEVRVKLN
jgi:type I restriction enzyme, S subunit